MLLTIFFTVTVKSLLKYHRFTKQSSINWLVTLFIPYAINARKIAHWRDMILLFANFKRITGKLLAHFVIISWKLQLKNLVFKFIFQFRGKTAIENFVFSACLCRKVYTVQLPLTKTCNYFIDWKKAIKIKLNRMCLLTMTKSGRMAKAVESKQSAFPPKTIVFH